MCVYRCVYALFVYMCVCMCVFVSYCLAFLYISWNWAWGFILVPFSLFLVLASYSGCSMFSFALLSLTRSFYSPYIVIGFALRIWAAIAPALCSLFFVLFYYLGFWA